MSIQANFIAMALPAARNVKAAYGVPIAVTIAQAALESGWGQHVKGNAYFGIKGHGINFDTTEVIDGQIVHVNDGFRAYTGFADAALDYGKFLTTNPRYAACFEHKDDPEGFVVALANAGYATQPDYAVRVLGVIHTNDLLQYDLAYPKG